MANERKPPAWVLKAEAEYLKGGHTYQTIADKFKRTKRSVERWASSRSWDEKRRQVVGKVSAELPDAIADLLISDHIRIAQEHFTLWELGRQKALTMLDAWKEIVTKQGDVLKMPAIADPNDLARWAAALKAITEGQRLAAGMIDPAAKAKAASFEDDEDTPKHGVVLLPMKDDEPLSPPPEPVDQQEDAG